MREVVSYLNYSNWLALQHVYPAWRSSPPTKVFLSDTFDCRTVQCVEALKAHRYIETFNLDPLYGGPSLQDYGALAIIHQALPTQPDIYINVVHLDLSQQILQPTELVGVFNKRTAKKFPKLISLKLHIYRLHEQSESRRLGALWPSPNLQDLFLKVLYWKEPSDVDSQCLNPLLRHVQHLEFIGAEKIPGLRFPHPMPNLVTLRANPEGLCRLLLDGDDELTISTWLPRLSTVTSLGPIEMPELTDLATFNSDRLGPTVNFIREGDVHTRTAVRRELPSLDSVSVAGLKLDVFNYDLPKRVVERLRHCENMTRVHLHVIRVKPGLDDFFENQLFPFLKRYPHLEEFKISTKIMNSCIKLKEMRATFGLLWRDFQFPSVRKLHLCTPFYYESLPTAPLYGDDNVTALSDGILPRLTRLFPNLQILIIGPMCNLILGPDLLELEKSCSIRKLVLIHSPNHATLRVRNSVLLPWVPRTKRLKSLLFYTLVTELIRLIKWDQVTTALEENKSLSYVCVMLEHQRCRFTGVPEESIKRVADAWKRRHEGGGEPWRWIVFISCCMDTYECEFIAVAAGETASDDYTTQRGTFRGQDELFASLPQLATVFWHDLASALEMHEYWQRKTF